MTGESKMTTDSKRKILKSILERELEQELTDCQVDLMAQFICGWVKGDIYDLEVGEYFEIRDLVPKWIGIELARKK